MTKTKVFFALGSVVLAASAFVTTKASNKFAGVTTAFVKNIGTLKNISSAHFTNVKGSGALTVFLITVSGGVLGTLITSSGSTKKVWYH